MSRLRRQFPVNRARNRPRLSLEALETRLTPSGGGLPVRITEYNVATGVSRTLSPEESNSALIDLQRIDEQARRAGYAGIGQLIGGPAIPDGSAPNAVIGPDGRVRVNNPANAYPFSAVGQIFTQYANGQGGHSSGAMVSEFHMLTAAHCVRRAVYQGEEFASSIRVAFGQDGEHFGGYGPGMELQSNNRYFGEANAVWIRSYSWNDQTTEGLNNDIAIVTLDRNIGAFTGTFGYGYDNDDGAFVGRSFNTAGYPRDLNGGGIFATHYQFRAFDPITSATPYQLRSNVMDTNGGNSGGPLWRYDGTNHYIYGVCSHSAGDPPVYNAWTRITSDKFNDLLVNPIAQDRIVRPPSDRPDLIEWDRWFNGSTASLSSAAIQPGQTWSVNINTRNNGTATAGAFRVSFYASTDGFIGTDDYLIGENSVSSLNPFHWTATGWSGAFPSSIPQGTYRVGWVIDSGNQQVEFNDFDNTGVFTQPLTVTVRGGTVSGVVFEDANGNSFRDVTESGQSGVIVYFDANRNQQFDSGETGTFTDSLGSYQLSTPDDSSYSVRQVAPGGFRQTTTDPADLLLVGGTFATASFGNRRVGGSIVGGVFADLNANGLREAGETGVSDVTIYVDSNGNRQRDAGETTTTTAADGIFALTFEADGDQTIRIQRPSGKALTTPADREVDVGGGTLTLVEDFGLADSPKLFAIGSGEGIAGQVKVYNSDGSLRRTISPYGSFTGGVRIATGDFNDDGVPDIVTGAGPGGGPHVQIFDGQNGALLQSLYPYAQNFTGGLYVATGDVNADGVSDLITGVGVGGGPHVRVFDGTSGAVLREFMAYDPNFRGGVIVAAGDVDGDGRADIITGVGPGGGPHVRVFSSANGSVLREWIAYDINFRGGVIVAAGDVDGDGKADIITGVGPGGGPHVKVFSGANGSLLREFLAYDVNFRGGVITAVRDLNGDGLAEIITAPGRTGGPHVKVFNGLNNVVLNEFLAFDPLFSGGIYVG